MSLVRYNGGWNLYILSQNMVDKKEAGFQLGSVLVKCSIEGSDNCRPIYTTYTSKFGNCFTINSDWTSIAVARNSSKMSRLRRVNGIYMHFYLYLDPNISYSRNTGAVITFSSPDSVPDLVNGVYSLKNGDEYTFFMSQSISYLLPPPYVTNCTDYDKMGKTSFRSGLLTQQTCSAECAANFTFKICGCIISSYPYLYDYPGSVRICRLSVEKGICNSQQLESETVNAEHYCNGKFRAPCRKVTYEFSLSKQPIIAPGTVDEKSTQQLYENFLKKPVSLEAIKSSGIKVNLMFKSKDFMLYQHYPKYQDVELFSYIGGYVGMWLGISLANVLEVITNFSIKIKNWYLNLKEQSSKIIKPIQTTDVTEK
ncbi:degenerin-like protein unc-105 [Tachypleus tridentatus]|uniref:degenerin-like protein unc-105 n=1 Tax=Tachypleus tridentatus TaxID=6853 RepID=UPI003FD099B1